MEPEAKKPPPPQITLRPFTLSDADADAFMSWAADDRVMRFFGPTYPTKDAAAAHIRSHIIPHPWYRAICVGGRTDRPVGWISINSVFRDDDDDNAHRATMGYGLAHEWWGRGVMTAAVRAAVATAFAERPRLERLEAFAAAENRRSQRVLEKVGFKREGLLRKYAVLMGESRDVVMFSFLDTDTINH
uniref:N-acetyltransferase domain-containing protein n=1 Tax=Ananas comosus var. bracteatus TaxID=296719 RepID=A0A6V7NN31_ANACO|nr:unnamed protein product [Ananas comosus var. bracteatus]